MIPIIFLDMDGVCCDFAGAALKAHGSPLKPQDIGVWNMETVMGLTLDEFWAPINDKGVLFWRDLEELPWFKELYMLCRNSAEEVVFLTSAYSPVAAAGKIMWLRDRFGSSFDNYSMTPKKKFVAHNRGVLIDDHVKNCNEWSKHGDFILFQQTWNRPVLEAWPEYFRKLRTRLHHIGKTYSGRERDPRE